MTTTELPPTLQHARDQLDDAWESLRTHGLWLQLRPLVDDKGQWIRYPPGFPVNSLRRVMRKSASEMKRQLVLAERSYRYLGTPARYKDDVIRIDIRRTKKLAPLRTSLQILATTETPSRWNYTPGISHHHGHSISTYTFVGPEAEQVFYAWLEQVKTNPDLRKAVGLPVE
jgi:hypothetical protein